MILYPGNDVNKFFKVVLSSVADGIFTVDEERRITSFNPAAERITGYSQDEAIGKKCYDIFHSDSCESGCLLKKTMSTGIESIDSQVNIINKNGDRIPISISTAVLNDDDHNVLGAVETFRDLSQIENLRKQLERSFSFEDIVTKSSKLLKHISVLPDIAESESTVLIEGASGSGKELFARAVHNLSPRSDHPLVVINCGTLPPQLFESEIFGYYQGAFTDAKKDKPGKLAAAEGGTVFFDEVGELPISLQVKLLRLLQEREYEPVGAVRPVKADIRIIAATNKNLKDLVEKGRFRDDLYFRLAVIKLELPSLIERREDIPLLVDTFLGRLNARKGKNIVGVSPRVMEVLMRYDYPGNVRELENMLEYGFAVCHGRTLRLEHLPQEMQDGKVSGRKHQDGLPQRHPVQSLLDEESQIRQMLAETNWNRSKAAKALGMDRTSLWRKMKKYSIKSLTTGS